MSACSFGPKLLLVFDVSLYETFEIMSESKAAENAYASIQEQPCPKTVAFFLQ